MNSAQILVVEDDATLGDEPVGDRLVDDGLVLDDEDAARCGHVLSVGAPLARNRGRLVKILCRLVARPGYYISAEITTMIVPIARNARKNARADQRVLVMGSPFDRARTGLLVRR